MTHDRETFAIAKHDQFRLPLSPPPSPVVPRGFFFIEERVENDQIALRLPLSFPVFRLPRDFDRGRNVYRELATYLIFYKLYLI